jgi:hypothetical protein
MVATGQPVYHQANAPVNNEQMNRDHQIAATITALEMYQRPMVVQNSPKEQELTCLENFLFILPNILLGMFCLPILGGLYTVEPMQAVVMTTFGKVIGVEEEAGPQCTWWFGVNKEYVSTQLQTT